MDQGGELFNNPEIKNLFTKSGYPTHTPQGPTLLTKMDQLNEAIAQSPTSYEHYPPVLALTQNSDRTHFITLSDYIMLFPPEHRIYLPSLAPPTSWRVLPISTVWVRPPGKRLAKLVPNSRKGLFLGYVPYTTRHVPDPGATILS